ncbi:MULTISPECIES: transglutaminase family protein [Paraburkholderia]|uniref:transglutaminase family protein n=1 Tax=Paraburkholderia TaxID=1822464 RepID=UPI0022519854|nr:MULTISPECIES: transglutaminase family protein [Paraburkholderia]MCX4163510.1 transglutaminase family protein [Paraburkholderia megapolitana]MDN7159005.1 transglutaminase family protein [Paraburkholderia sp. CHISQ3]MDQ6496052.1 transglutaminase family protein [Paraburkholderia megapolitana]
MTTATVLSVSHRTAYRYSTPVETAQHLATIRPLACPWQRVVSHTEQIEPTPSYLNSRIDAFGNDVLYFSLDAPHESLQMTSETVVRLSPRWHALDPDATPAWEEVAERLRFRAGGEFFPESEFCFASPNIVLLPALRAYALPSFAPGTPLVAGAIDLMHRIHADFEYRPATTTFDTPAQRAFELRSGVCQDFAQVMIGCLRALGLPARYVSGYLRNDPPPGQPRLIGADASHAWVSVHCPQSGWIDLDPTNDVLADLDHVTLALGRDYSDVSLLRGMILGGGAHQVEVGVSVLAL